VTAPEPPSTHASLGGRDLRGWRLLRCAGCGLPTARCLCAELPRLDLRTRVVVVMHRIEALRSTNTGRLAAAMLARATLRIRGDRDRPDEPPPAGRRLVLFPAEGARPLTTADAADDLVLVVPDGTWSQARRIHRRDPCARDAETVTLPTVVTSAYALRRNARAGGLCTLEAIAAALAVLEGPSVATVLREVFARWHERATAARDGRADPSPVTSP
jgi:DTW domain-containing protein YfiP